MSTIQIIYFMCLSIQLNLTEFKNIPVTATCFNAVEQQTDDTPLITAFGYEIDAKHPFKHKYIAVSRDLLTHFSAGDTVLVSGTFVYDGLWIVADKMNKKYCNRIDFLVPLDSYQHVFKASIMKYHGQFNHL